MDIIQYGFIWFFIHSVIGWVVECGFNILYRKQIVNRGFLNGPYCPIYGFGALTGSLLLKNVESPLLIFLLGAVGASLLEYITSVILKKIFHRKWWDYSKRRFNINGRICAVGTVLFGLYAILIVKFEYPLFCIFIHNVPEIRNVLSIALFIIMIIDLICSCKKYFKHSTIEI